VALVVGLVFAPIYDMLNLEVYLIRTLLYFAALIAIFVGGKLRNG
jgi:hypothetical protein